MQNHILEKFCSYHAINNILAPITVGLLGFINYIFLYSFIFKINKICTHHLSK